MRDVQAGNKLRVSASVYNHAAKLYRQALAGAPMGAGELESRLPDICRIYAGSDIPQYTAIWIKGIIEPNAGLAGGEMLRVPTFHGLIGVGDTTLGNEIQSAPAIAVTLEPLVAGDVGLGMLPGRGLIPVRGTYGYGPWRVNGSDTLESDAWGPLMGHFITGPVTWCSYTATPRDQRVELGALSGSLARGGSAQAVFNTNGRTVTVKDVGSIILSTHSPVASGRFVWATGADVKGEARLVSYQTP